MGWLVVLHVVISYSRFKRNWQENNISIYKNNVIRSAVQGMGYPFMPMCSGIAEMALRIGFIYVFFQNVGFAATAYAEAAAWTVAFLLNLVTYIYLFIKKSGSRPSTLLLY